MQKRYGSESDRAWEFCSLRFYKEAVSQCNYWAEAHNRTYKFIVSAIGWLHSQILNSSSVFPLHSQVQMPLALWKWLEQNWLATFYPNKLLVAYR